ncbi:GNAT family N-acetyltransferase [Paenibacillus sepulcri]|uniref:GNAT family N-acetyltransferase n=1 Tax=Paenibacillus sepulcri TaxID=359917 RepID=A0ABS7C3Z9_9BACL|nr:GNAT family N-acetyltransferase [Paenibacillus sepulcri]
MINGSQPFPLLQTKRLYLRQLRISDDHDLYSVYADAQVTRFLDWYGPGSVEEARELIQSWNEHYEMKSLLPWGIARKTDDALIGTIMYMPLRGTFETEPLFPITIGFELARPYWNQGLMTEALEEVTAYGAHHIGAHRIQADVRPENEASIRLLKKCGFKVEGLLKKYLKHEVTQIFLDVIVLALITS